jgi:hypothetical protein
MIPFSLVDRPNHVRMLRRLDLYRTYPLVPVGIMTHANVTPAVQALIRAFPCGAGQCSDVSGAPCLYYEDQGRCPYHCYIRQRAVIMCDSGVFTRQGATLAYPQLFETYARMAVDYGIMIDRLHDSSATIESARRALDAYGGYEEQFSLVAVAQGKSLDDYLRCYQQLKALGFRHVAIGGLLHKVEGSARYTRVEAESFLWLVISSIRSLFPSDWLFALGALHPRRISRLVQYHVWADSKWYLFQYPKAGQRGGDQGERGCG